ncbi:MAG: GDSL-type esterase/lipase family protein [Verrucomicrobiota bacterium]
MRILDTKNLCRLFVASLLLLINLKASAAEDLSAPEGDRKKSDSKVIQRYEKWLDILKGTPPPAGALICIGSSQMEFWKTVATDLAPLTVYNHGIGGSRMSHAADLFITNLAIPFKPRAVILYEGSNDLAGGVPPETVLEQFQKLHTKLHEALPETRLYVLGLVPSPGKRFDKIEDLRKTNALLRKECESQAWMKFIDTTSPLIGVDGVPKEECFIPGNIHMTPAGYSVWTSVIAPVVIPAEKVFEK